MAVQEHEHDYEPTFRLSHFTGTPHRRCMVEGCECITLDGTACDCGDYDNCSDCGTWRDETLAFCEAAGLDPKGWI